VRKEKTMSWAVVTGAGSGIGAVIARHLVKEGYRVAVWDVDRHAADAVAGELGSSAVAATVDVGDEASVDAGFAALGEVPAVVVNNAGRVRFGPLVSLSVEDWRAVIDVNLTGTFLVSRAAARRMAEAGGGAIVSISSVNGIAAAPNAGAYTSTKAAIIMLTEQMALEWAPLGVRVNCVAPGLILAGMSDPIYADPEIRALRQSKVPLGTLGTADDVAAAVLFLASDKAGYVTGQTIAVDGGLTKAAMLGLSRPKSVDTVGER
jgi:NAD(P)-dependent dehydrogenase (short-subunit alcohol dehydrogenase family)